MTKCLICESDLKVTSLSCESCRTEYKGRFLFPRLARLSQEEQELAEEMNLSVEKVRQVLQIAQEPVSLETTIGDEDNTHLADFIEDKDAKSPVSEAVFSMLGLQIRDVLYTLSDREKEVITLRFGLNDGYQRTLEEVGNVFSVTRERVRQIEAKALKKLRHPVRSQQLRGFMDTEEP